MQAPANSVSLEAQADQVGRVEGIESLLAGKRHISSLQVAGFGGGYRGRRNRKMPRVRSGRPCVRSRFDAVETPLNSTKKSRNARRKPFFFGISVGDDPCTLNLSPISDYFIRWLQANGVAGNKCGPGGPHDSRTGVRRYKNRRGSTLTSRRRWPCLYPCAPGRRG